MTEKNSHLDAREASVVVTDPLVFSVCTLVNDQQQYQSMLSSFKGSGFSRENTEFLYLDNVTTNRFDCYTGLNLLIQQCVGRYIVLCHQDVQLLSDGCKTLMERLDELDDLDPVWALAGNAGKTATGVYCIRITDLHGDNQHRGPLPARVLSLDENFIVLRRSASIGFSTDLEGYHLYGTDICLQAAVRGRSAYVIDFHLQHLGAGTVRQDFFDCADALEQKYLKVFKRRLVKTPSTRVVAGASKWELLLRALVRLRKRRKILKKSRQIP